MKKDQSILKVAAAMLLALGLQTNANAQLGGLMKKAKSAVKDKVENKAKMAGFEAKAGVNDAVSNATGVETSSSDSGSSSSSNKGKHPKSLNDLDKSLFIYSVTDNADFYDVTNPKVEKGYVDFCNTCTQTEVEGRHVPYDMLAFEDCKTSNGVKQVHLTDLSFAAYYSYFMMNPTEVSGYQCYVRARLMRDCYRFDKVAVFPYEQVPPPGQGWKEVYPGSKNQRNITLKNGKSISLIETETARQKRWDDVQSAAEDILLANTPYNVVRSVLKGTLDAIKQCDAAGNNAACTNLLREAGYMIQDLGSHPLHNKDEQFQDIREQYNQYFTQKRLGWLKAAGNASAKPVEMPKAANVSAEIQNQATAKAKAKFGAKFVKAIVTESDWHVYKEPNYPYDISHRTMNVDVIIKEGNDYFVSHQMLWQNYTAGKFSGYDLRNSQAMNRPIQQKVNYK